MSSSVWQYFRKTNKGMIESIFRVKKLNGDIQWYIIDRQGIRYKIEDVTGETYETIQYIDPATSWMVQKKVVKKEL